MIKILTLFVVLCLSHPALAQDWASSPLNPNNSDQNPDNSPHNPKNSPYHKDNSPYNPQSKNTIRDTDGNITGYKVEKEDGGSNLFDTNGKRTGYTPSRP